MTLRPLVLLAALVAAATSTGALAMDGIAGPAAPRQAPDGSYQVAQDSNYEIFYDGRGNRVVLDDRTGRVISVEPPQSRLDRRALRRQERMRRLRQDGGVDPYGDATGDQADMPRRSLRDDYGAPDGGGYDAQDSYDNGAGADDGYGRDYGNGGFGGDRLDQFPPPPGRRDQAAVPGARDPDPLDQQPAVEPPVERQPLDEASIAPAPQPGDQADDTDNQPAVETPPLQPDVSVNSSLSLGSRSDIAALQVLLDRGGASPGVIDGRFGSNVDKALSAYNNINGTALRSTDTAAIKDALGKTGGDAFASYTITPEDVAGPYVASIPEDYSQKAKLDRMGYTSVPEALAERFHMDEAYLKAINPGVNFDRPGTIIKVANFGRLVSTPVTRIVADKAKKEVYAFGADGKLVAAYPATIGSTDTPSPSGTHAVSRIALNPNYTYNPNINFKQGDNNKVLTIPPGPNGPVGSVWIALDKPTYGIHGTPEPSKIGKTASHGCVRLTNWDANELAKLVKPGVTVEFVD